MSQSSAPWRTSLDRNLASAEDPVVATFVQLATVAPDGRPANRTVAFRGFAEGTDHPLFVTDVRSDKIRHLEAHPWAAICWYFGHSRQQFRLMGDVALITAGHGGEHLQVVRRRIWRDLSQKTQRQFYWPAPLTPMWQATARSALRDPVSPPASFCVISLHPRRVEHLDIAHYPHRRIIYRFEAKDGWSIQEVHP